MEELDWHKPLVQIQRSGRTAFFSSLSFFFFNFFFFLGVVLKLCYKA